MLISIVRSAADIRKLPANESTVGLCGDVVGYKYHNVTKYYENDIVFVSHESKHISLIPAELHDRIEGCIIYFDAENVIIARRSPPPALIPLCRFQKEFLNKLPAYADFIDANNIEFGLLLCKELFDSPADGVTYKEAKSCSNTLDVIELNRQQDSNRDDGNAGHHDPVGYEELLQAIRAIVWSNVNMKRKTAVPEPGEEAPSDEEDTHVEAELASFEQLLSEVMMFKEATASWSRSERLAHAEKFACEPLRFDAINSDR